MIVSADNPQEENSKTVFIVDDEKDMRDALCQLMRSVQLPVEAFEDGNAFLDAWRPEMRGCLILDLRMPKMSGYEVLLEMRARSVTLPSILFSVYGNIRSAVDAMRAGAFDFIEKPIDEQELLDVVHRALKREAELKRHGEWLRNAKVRFETLTEREKSVFFLIADGYHNKEIAAKLDISVRTVENHRASVIRKMEAEAVAHLVRLAIGIRKTDRNRIQV